MKKHYSFIILTLLLYLGSTISKPSLRNKTKKLARKNESPSIEPESVKSDLKYKSEESLSNQPGSIEIKLGYKPIFLVEPKEKSQTRNKTKKKHSSRNRTKKLTHNNESPSIQPNSVKTSHRYKSEKISLNQTSSVEIELGYKPIYLVEPKETSQLRNRTQKQYSEEQHKTKTRNNDQTKFKKIPRAGRNKNLRSKSSNKEKSSVKKSNSPHSSQRSEKSKNKTRVENQADGNKKSRHSDAKGIQKEKQGNPPGLQTGPVRDDNTSLASEIDDSLWNVQNKDPVDTRRILYSKESQHPYMSFMVYLQLAKNSKKAQKYRGWLCGGVIVHRYYVLTSAACVEDADHFFVVSGTSKWLEAENVRTDKCICKNRRKVIWKCTPKSYRFDFRDSEKWAANDIAIVRVDRAFLLNVKEHQCEYATEVIAYNNRSRSLEVAGIKGYILGWGSKGNFREGVYRKRREEPSYPVNSNTLQVAKVLLMDNELCTKKWAPKFREIIRRYMICTRDILKRLSSACDKTHAKCKEIEDDYRKSGRYNETLLQTTGLQLKENMVVDVDNDIIKDIELKDEPEDKPVKLDLGRHLRDPDDISARRSSWTGGFCENDHGGPLVVNDQGTLVTIGVISACKIDPKKHMCHGPFLYTSIFNNRQFISCSIYKDVEETCRRVFRTGVTHDEWAVDWTGVEDEDELAERAGENGSLNTTDVLEPLPSVPANITRNGVNNQENNKTVTNLGEYAETSSEANRTSPRTEDKLSVDNVGKLTNVNVEVKPEENLTEKSASLQGETKIENPKTIGEVVTKDSSHILNVFKSFESSKEEGVNDPADLVSV